MTDTSKLVNGGLYLIRWKVRRDYRPVFGLFRTDREECDVDETPCEEWLFWGTEMTAPADSYEPITRLDVTHVDWDDPNAGAWPE